LIESKNRNSFKELQEETNEVYKDNLNNVKKSVDGNINSMAFITNIIDVYFAKVISYVVNLSGGKDLSDDKKDINDDEKTTLK